MKAIDLFAGAGGLSLGLQQAGITVVAAVEWDADACATYRANVGDHIIEADIETIDPATLPECDLIAGGPPCQGFSYAGKRDPNDPRNRLWQEYWRIVEAKRPAFILMENVRGMLSAGADKPLIVAFRKIGYRITPYLLNAADYGVPQLRLRVFYIGNRLGLENPLPAATHWGLLPHERRTAKRHMTPMLGLTPWVTVRQALGIGGTMRSTHRGNAPTYDGDAGPARTITSAARTDHGFEVVEPRLLLQADPYLAGARGDMDQPAVTVNAGSRSDHVPALVELLDSPSATIRSGAHGAPGYSPRHQAGYVPEDPILDAPSSTIRHQNGGHDVGRMDKLGLIRPQGWVPTERTDHGLLDLDAPARTIKAGGMRDASGHEGGATPPSILDLNIPLDQPSPTILGGAAGEGSGHTGGAEPVRRRLKNRYAEHGEGATFDEPAPTVSADRALEEHWLDDAYDVAPTLQADPRVSKPGHHGPGEPRMMLRRLTPHECQLLQGFPANFVFTGTKTSVHRQIGNAVPPVLARALGTAIRAAFERKEEHPCTASIPA